MLQEGRVRRAVKASDFGIKTKLGSNHLLGNLSLNFLPQFPHLLNRIRAAASQAVAVIK